MSGQLRGRAGFTLIEVLVALAIMTAVMVGFLELFDTSAKIAKAQSAISDVQENLRFVMDQLVKTSRMTGAGGLPAVAEDDSGIDTITDDNSGTFELAAIWVEDNVQSPSPIGGRTPLEDSDVLWVRGCFGGEIYDMDAANYSFGGGSGSFTVAAVSRSGQTQDVSKLEDLVNETPNWVPAVFTASVAEDLTLASGKKRPVARYGVGIISAVATASTGSTFSFTSAAIDNDQLVFIGMNRNEVFNLPTGSPVSRVAAIGQRRFFIAEDDDGVPTLYVNTPETNVSQPVASDLVDLQVALGCDVDDDGRIAEDSSNPPTAGSDEWLFNADGEARTDQSGGVPMVAYLTQARITLVARVPVPDRNWVQPEVYNENGRDLLADRFRGFGGQSFRYRSLTERVKLRSLGPIM